METNIQSLLDKIYEDGIEKAQEKAKNILQDAEVQANQILTKAQEESKVILDKAKLESEFLKSSLLSDLKYSETQLLNSLKTKIADLLVLKVSNHEFESLNQDNQFLKEILVNLINTWIQNQVPLESIELLFPLTQRKKIEEYLKLKFGEEIKGISIEDGNLNGSWGFQIHYKSEGYKIDFSEESLRAFYRNFLKTKTKEFLFGKNEV
jgi:V/A-type H+-transporting ATPase subunit E